jgi:alcohol dehydrogenase, propanol-preferring
MNACRVVAYRSPLEMVELPTPEPFGTEVLIEVTACGVCHSDLHYWHGGYDLGDGRMLTLEERGVRLPIVLGHEPIGRVVAMGRDARGVSAGDTRLIYPWIGCGRCPRCEAGRDNDCLAMQTIGLFRPGGYATHVLVPHPRYLLETAGLEDAYAATLACAGLTAWSALSKIAVRYADDGIVMIGAGGVGLTAMGFARALWDCPLVAVDQDASRLASARAMGATHTAVSGGGSGIQKTAEAIQSALGGLGAAVIDFVGSPETAELGLRVLRKGGTLVLIGLHGGSWSLSVPLLPLRNIALVGSLTGTVAETREVIDFVRGKKPRQVPVTQVLLSDAHRALMNLESGRGAGRQILVPHLS